MSQTDYFNILMIGFCATVLYYRLHFILSFCLYFYVLYISLDYVSYLIFKLSRLNPGPQYKFHATARLHDYKGSFNPLLNLFPCRWRTGTRRSLLLQVFLRSPATSQTQMLSMENWDFYKTPLVMQLEVRLLVEKRFRKMKRQ